MQTIYPARKYCSNCHMNNHNIQKCWKLNGRPNKGKQKFNNTRSIQKPANASEETNKKQAANSTQAMTDKESKEMDIKDVEQNTKKTKKISNLLIQLHFSIIKILAPSFLQIPALHHISLWTNPGSLVIKKLNPFAFLRHLRTHILKRSA